MPACKHPRNTYTQPSLTGKKLLNLQKAEEEEDATRFRRSRSASMSDRERLLFRSGSPIRRLTEKTCCG